MSGNILRSLRLFFQTSEPKDTKPFSRLTRVHQGLQYHLIIFYLVCAYFSFRTFDWPQLEPGDRTPPYLFYFIQYYPNLLFKLGFVLTPLFLLFSALLPRKKWISRIALFSYIHWGALTVTSGITDNGIRPSIWLATCLLFLPFPKLNRRFEKLRFVQWYWFSLLVFLLSYVMAGFWKLIYGGVYQLFFDHFGIWNFQSLSYIIYNYIVKTGNTSWGALLVADNPWFGWPGFLFSIYLECTIFIVLFRPSLWRLYALGILCMHIGTKIALDIGFETQFLLAGLLMFTSPFLVENTLREQFRELPLVYSVRKLLQKAK